VVAIALLAYHSRSDTLEGERPPPAAKDDANGRSGPANSGVIGRNDAPSPAPEPDKGKAAAPPPPPSPATALDAPSRTPATPPRQGQAATGPPDTKAGVAETRPTAPPRAAERAPSRPQACTEATAALGLCVMKPVPKGGVPASARASVARAEATDATGAEAPEPPRAPAPACTDAVVALGLCSPKPTPRKE
jgi:hypothetical protein